MIRTKRAIAELDTHTTVHTVQSNGHSNNHANISLRLSSYDDIFSMFDPRQYSERALSVDFLQEAERASIDKTLEQLELRLMVPLRLRNAEQERMINRRLKLHFARHETKILEERNRIITKGIIFCAVGILVMFLAAIVSFKYADKTLFMHFLLVFLEPAGWFLLWEGMYQIVFEAEHTKPKMEFYKKMKNSSIIFISY